MEGEAIEAAAKGGAPGSWCGSLSIVGCIDKLPASQTHYSTPRGRMWTQVSKYSPTGVISLGFGCWHLAIQPPFGSHSLFCASVPLLAVRQGWEVQVNKCGIYFGTYSNIYQLKERRRRLWQSAFCGKAAPTIRCLKSSAPLDIP